MCKFNKVNKNTVSQYKTINLYWCSNVMSPLVINIIMLSKYIIIAITKLKQLHPKPWN